MSKRKNFNRKFKFFFAKCETTSFFYRRDIQKGFVFVRRTKQKLN